MRSISSMFHNWIIHGGLRRGGLRRLGLGLVVVILIGVILIYPSDQPSTQGSGPGEASAQSANPTQTPTLDPVSEVLANRSQTNGIILGAAVLMLIILFATLGSFRRHPAAHAPENIPPKEP